jgi:hypothetical protein
MNTAEKTGGFAWAVVDRFEFTLEGHASAACGNPTLHIILGGAAVHRCDKRLVLNAGFSP